MPRPGIELPPDSTRVVADHERRVGQLEKRRTPTVSMLDELDDVEVKYGHPTEGPTADLVLGWVPDPSVPVFGGLWKPVLSSDSRATVTEIDTLTGSWTGGTDWVDDSITLVVPPLTGMLVIVDFVLSDVEQYEPPGSISGSLGIYVESPWVVWMETPLMSTGAEAGSSGCGNYGRDTYTQVVGMVVNPEDFAQNSTLAVKGGTSVFFDPGVGNADVSATVSTVVWAVP